MWHICTGAFFILHVYKDYYRISTYNSNCLYPGIHTYPLDIRGPASPCTGGATPASPSWSVGVQPRFGLWCSTGSHYKTTGSPQTVIQRECLQQLSLWTVVRMCTRFPKSWKNIHVINLLDYFCVMFFPLILSSKCFIKCMWCSFFA